MNDIISIGSGKNARDIVRIGIGTWKIPNDSASGIEAIRHALGLGINFVDTAEMYGNEEMVGKAIKGFENVKIATKVSPSHFKYGDVLRSCDSSLKRLGVKKVFLYQLHWPNNRIPISETMKAMEKLLDEGKIMNIGVSNFSVEEMIKAQQSLDHSKIASNQIEYSIAMRDPESGVLEFCNKEGIAVIAYSPLSRGAIYSDKDLMAKLEQTGLKYGKTAIQVALRYLLQKGNVIAIPKAISINHIEENYGAIGWELSKADMEELDSMEGFSKPPLAGKFLKAFLKNTTIWAKLMEKNERMRKDHQ